MGLIIIAYMTVILIKLYGTSERADTIMVQTARILTGVEDSKVLKTVTDLSLAYRVNHTRTIDTVSVALRGLSAFVLETIETAHDHNMTNTVALFMDEAMIFADRIKRIMTAAALPLNELPH